MKKTISILIIAFLVFILIPSNNSADAAVSNWQKGVTIYPRWNTDYSSSSFQQSITNLASTNANYVALVIPIYQSNIYSTDIQNGSNTPTDQSLVDGVNYIHSKGMRVMFIPHLDSWDGQWRAQINPGDRTTWFNNYGNFMLHFAQIAKQTGVEEFSVGSELINMSSDSINGTNTANWNSLIGKIRAAYGGALTYSSNWGDSGWVDEVDQIKFWPSLDYIGISAYYELRTGSDNSVGALMNAWSGWNSSRITPIHNQYGKPVLFTEIGYKSVTGAHNQPWNYSYPGGYDGQEQANDYQALFQYWNNVSFMQGGMLWYWNTDPNYGGAGNTDYTPQNKPAQQTMTQWFGGAGNPSPSPSTTPAPNSFSAAGSANPANPSVNQTTSISVNVTNSGSAMGGLISDIEIYNSANQKVFQQFFGNQSFNQNQTQTYNVSWTPVAADNYKIAVGVFNSNWTVNYYWNGNAGNISVGQGTTPSPTPTPTPSPSPTPTPSPSPAPAPGGTINIWWPTNGVTVTGVQPFKAMLKNGDISTYNMYWQVDSGALNPMFNSTTDYPHKEADVDVTNWSWNGNGPYKINFVAKDLSGNLITQSAINIFVSH